METIPHLIDGKAVLPADGRAFYSVDPFRQRPWATVAHGGVAEVEQAVAAARRAADEGPWPRLTPDERRRVLYRFADLIEDDAAELARRDTWSVGKPYRVVRDQEVAAAAADLRDHADLARIATGSTYPRGERWHVYTRYPPAGVVAAITPWNFPVPIAASKIGPALAWGNAVVLKPAEQCPASATRLAELGLEAGLPPGVLNVVHGFGPGGVGQELVSSPLVDRVTFTGSTVAGAAIASAAGANLTPVQLECGGKSAQVVFADADLNAAVQAAVLGGFTNSGQMCVAASRLYVQRPAFDDVLTRLVAQVRRLRLGDPMDPATDLGPLSSREQYDRVCRYLDRIPADGGELLTGGRGDAGWFVHPTVVVGLPPEAPACREEIFGPVVVAAAFDTDDEAVAAANATEYGLSASLFTGDVRRAHTVAAQLRAGIVWVNTFGVRDWRAPFGGHRRSGVGREGGEVSRAFFTEPTVVTLGL